MPANLGRLLIVDDQRDFGRFLGAVAEQHGFATRILRHSLDFDFVMRHWHPNIVALEIMMPGRDGMEIVRYLSEGDYRGHIILMGSSKKSYLEWYAENLRAQGLPVAAVLSKPCRKLQIVRALMPLRHLKDAA